MTQQPPIKKPRLSSAFSAPALNMIEEELKRKRPLPKTLRNQIGAGDAPHNVEDYVKQLDNQLDHNPKFKCVKAKSKFMITNVPADPEALLAGIFQFCIDQAIEKGTTQGIKPDRLGCTISSELLNPDIWIPLRPITDNTVDSILNQFLLVAQSKWQDGLTLWGAPFNVEVTSVNRGSLPSKRQISGGAPRVLAPVNHRINDRCLIKINNSKDKYCLFYALQATLVHLAGPNSNSTITCTV
jgi:hypothetical protein